MTVWLDFAEIRAKVPIERVLLEMYGLGDRLKRQGKKLIGACPIHRGDNSRAFQVDLEKGVYFCFSGCGRKGGNAIDFVVAMEGGISVREAALKLHAAFITPHEGASSTSKPAPASATSISPSKATPLSAPASAIQRAPPSSASATNDEEKEDVADATPNPPLKLRLELAHDHPHLLRDRGLSIEAAKAWGIGYCRRGMLRSMIAVPVHDEDGALVAYVGRRLRPQEIESFGKYRFPKNFRSDLVLYNLWRAKSLPPEEGLVIVEGFFATIALSERGMKNVVASMGCSISSAQVDLLAEHTAHVTLLYDGDVAGRSGADAALALLDARGVPASVIRLPEGWKPDQAPLRLLRWAVQGVRILNLRELVIAPQLASPTATQRDE